jgi:preprotein translocase subunit SecD
MNRYPLWKYLLIAIVVSLAALYALPNFFGEAPAVQISSVRATVKIDSSTLATVESALADAGLKPDQVTFEGTSIKARFTDLETQEKAKVALQKALIPNPESPNFVIALNLVSRAPAWMAALNARPMYLGLDLRGGVHFMLQVDMQAALTKKAESLAGDLRSTLREKGIRHGGISRDGQSVTVKVKDDATLKAVQDVLTEQFPDLAAVASATATDLNLVATVKPEAAKRIQDQALKQNIVTLHNRINELGVSEPVIQQQGTDRIVVQLPGVQDTARAKDILGRTATLEFRLVDESIEGHEAERNNGVVPFGSEKIFDAEGRPNIVKKQVIISGDSLTDAQPGFDNQTNQPLVNLSVDGKGGRIMRDISRENIDKRMAIIMFEKGKGEVLTAPGIRGELGNRFQISGSMTTAGAADLALLLRAGALAAPMEIIEESTIGPSLGKDNITKGFNSVTWGFLVIVAFMCVYYYLFGVFSSLALGLNLLMLVAVLSLLQATLTLPGVAAMALALGMAIDSNVLINERVREELRLGASPQAAISTGFDRAWATILDSNITTLIAGAALLAFGSGPVRGFAVVHCIGILTSMFSAVLFSRGLVNLWYGRQKKLKSISIGTVWRPAGADKGPDTTAKETSTGSSASRLAGK